MLHANFMAVCFTEPELLIGEDYAKNDFRRLSLLCLDLDPMTFIYDLGLYSLEIGLHRMCKYKLPTSKLSKVIL